MNAIGRIMNSGLWQLCVVLSPLVLIFIAVKFHEDFFREIPPAASLRLIEGKVFALGMNNCECPTGTIDTAQGRITFKYFDLGTYGWGPKSFPRGTAVRALLQDRAGKRPLAWALTLGDQEIYRYHHIATPRLADKAFARTFMLPVFVIACLFALQLVWQIKFGMIGQKDSRDFYEALQRSADRTLPDEERLRVLQALPAMAGFDATDSDYDYHLCEIGSTNTESEHMLTAVGEMLGALWAQHATDRLDDGEDSPADVLLRLQPAAKAAAVRVLHEANPALVQDG